MIAHGTTIQIKVRCCKFHVNYQQHETNTYRFEITEKPWYDKVWNISNQRTTESMRKLQTKKTATNDHHWITGSSLETTTTTE